MINHIKHSESIEQHHNFLVLELEIYVTTVISLKYKIWIWIYSFKDIIDSILKQYKY